MAGATQLVRQALAELGADAPDAEVRAYLREKAPSVPGSYVALALRRIRGRVISVQTNSPKAGAAESSAETGPHPPTGDRAS
jgi:hypothetical protein